MPVRSPADAKITTQRLQTVTFTGRPVTEVSPRTLSSEWFGEVEHTHRAIDDARGYANLLTYLLAKASR